MLFMSLRCKCMMSLAFCLSVDMQPLCKIESELPIPRIFAQRKQNNRHNHTNNCRTSARFSRPDWEPLKSLVEEISRSAPERATPLRHDVGLGDLVLLVMMIFVKVDRR